MADTARGSEQGIIFDAVIEVSEILHQIGGETLENLARCGLDGIGDGDAPLPIPRDALLDLGDKEQLRDDDRQHQHQDQHHEQCHALLGAVGWVDPVIGLMHRRLRFHDRDPRRIESLSALLIGRSRAIL